MLDMGSSSCSLPSFLLSCSLASRAPPYTQPSRSWFTSFQRQHFRHGGISRSSLVDSSKSLEKRMEGPSRFHHNCNPLQSEVRDPVMQMWMQLHTLSSCREKKQFSDRRVDTGDRMRRHPSALYHAPPEINILSRPTPTLPFISKSALHIFLG